LFQGFGHTPSAKQEVPILEKNTGSVSRFVAETKKEVRADAPVELINPEYPNTLDLRKFWHAKN
jgi:hypothetical protein